MKVVAINGSARKNGNTATLMGYVLEELDAAGINTELIQLAGKDMHGCRACRNCFKNKDRRCSQDDDFGNECIAKMDEAQGIILGSPTYFANVSAEMKALIDRAGLVGKANDGMYRRKVGAGVVAVRRAGSQQVFNALNAFFTISEMIIPGASYWNMGLGRDKGDVVKDDEGVNTMRVLGRNMAWVMNKVYA
ncbi:MAG: flavodoxin family protein [Desulfonatronovibrionaceae bacterium]